MKAAQKKPNIIMGREYGPHIKTLSDSTWYGSHGGCGICGHAGDSLIPRAIRYWDQDDGWRVDPLCTFCAEEASERGPDPCDYAWEEKADPADLDLLADILGEDIDGVYTLWG